MQPYQLYPKGKYYLYDVKRETVKGIRFETTKKAPVRYPEESKATVTKE